MSWVVAFALGTWSLWPTAVHAQPVPDAGPADQAAPTTPEGAEPDDGAEQEGVETSPSDGQPAATTDAPDTTEPGADTAEPTAPDSGAAQETPDPAPAPQSSWPANLHAAGFVDVFTMIHVQDPGHDRLRLRAFDTRSSELVLQYAELAVWMPAEPIGFRIDLGFGATAALVNNADPVNDPGAFGTVLPSLLQSVQQAYGSAHFDVGGGLTLDVGKFVTPLGQEVIETRDNWAYSRSLLFNWAIPYYHFGLRLNYVFGEAFNATLLVVNGWNNVVDNNDGKTFGIGFAARPHEMLQLYGNYMFGPEQTGENGHLRHVADVTAIFSPTSMIQLGLNFDFGFEPGIQPADDDDPMTPPPEPYDAMWMGAALSARVAPTDWLAVAARGEWYSDRDGFTTGTGIEDLTVFEGTLTLEARYQANMLVRLEYRHDQANEDIFFSDGDDDGPTSAGQDTITLGTVIGF